MDLLVALFVGCAGPPDAEVVLSPPDPTTRDDLTAWTVLRGNARGDGADISWRWSRDGTWILDLRGDRVPAERTAAGQIWRVEGVGATWTASAEVVVGDHPPLLSDPRILPATATADQPLTVDVRAWDPDGGAIDLAVTWHVGDRIVAGETLPASAFTRGDAVFAHIVATDPAGGTAAIDTPVVTIGNAPPRIVAVDVAPDPPREDTPASCLGIVEDADDDLITLGTTWYRDGVAVGASAGLTGASFDRGDAIHCVLTPDDGRDVGAPVASPTVVVGNSAPTLGGITFGPVPPTAEDPVVATVYGAQDPDDDPVSVEIHWWIDGAHGGTGDQWTSPARGQTIEAQAIPSDGLDVGVAVTSGVMTVANAPPVASPVTLIPATASASDPVTAEVEVRDSDGDPVAVSVTWRADGVVVGTGGVLPAGRARRGQAITAEVLPHDGLVAGVPQTSPPLVLANALPTVTRAAVFPPDLRADDVARCVGAPEDVDGDPVHVAIAWTVDGFPVGTGPTLAGAFAKGDLVACTLTPSDPTATGPSASASVIVQDRPPAPPRLAIDPADPYADEAVTCRVVEPGADPDGDPVATEITWTVDGAPWLGPVETEEIAGDTVPFGQLGFGQTWRCRGVSVADDLDAGASAGVRVPDAPGGNVLLVILDDVGIDKVEAYGVHPEQPVLPTLADLADRGMRFDNVWAHPVCSPTRAGILTGRLPRRTGMGATSDSHVNHYPLPPAEVSLPEALRLSPWGYTTVMLGKWHVDHAVDESWPSLVWAQGWDDFAGTASNLQWATSMLPTAGSLGWVDSGDTGAGVPQAPSYDLYEKYEDGTLYWSTHYATSDTIDDAVDRIGSLPEPWFVQISLHAPHTPWSSPPDDLHDQGDLAASPPWVTHHAMLQAADVELGRLLETIPPQTRDRTNVFVVGDNGTQGAAIRPPFDPGRDKGTMYEGGIRVPLIVAGPVVHAPGTASPELVHTTDLFATTAHIAGVRLGALDWALGGDPSPQPATGDTAAPPRTGRVPIDGRSLLPFLHDPLARPRRKTLYTERFSPNGDADHAVTDTAVIRDGRYKLLVDHVTGDTQLWDLAVRVPDEGPGLIGTDPLDQAQQAAHEALYDMLIEQQGQLSYDH